jgi:hypothetical protein
LPKVYLPCTTGEIKSGFEKKSNSFISKGMMLFTLVISNGRVLPITNCVVIGWILLNKCIHCRQEVLVVVMHVHVTIGVDQGQWLIKVVLPFQCCVSGATAVENKIESCI